MTLIEIMLQYQEYVRDVSQDRAIQFLYDVCDESLGSHIMRSFDSFGDFLCADDDLLIVGDGRFLKITPQEAK
jgi:hypothetical protein